MRVVVLTDCHFGARNDSPLFADYFDLFYRTVFFPYLVKNDIKTVLLLGDLYERRKFINFVTLNRVRTGFIEPLVQMGIQVHLTVGNHDIYWKNTVFPNSPTELLRNTPGFTIYTSPEVVNIGGLDILLVPWIPTDTAERDIQIIQESSAHVVAGHLEIAGFEMFRGINCDHGLDARIFQKFHLVMTGHFHHKSSKGNIHYLGSPYEMNWSDVSDFRGVHIFDTETLSLTFIPNPYRMFYRLEYDDRGKTSEEVLGERLDHLTDRYVKVVVAQRTNPYLFDRFLDKVYAVGPADVTTVEDFSLDIQEQDNQDVKVEDTVSILNNYVDSIGLDLNKDRLKRVLAELYNEALVMESET